MKARGNSDFLLSFLTKQLALRLKQFIDNKKNTN